MTQDEIKEFIQEFGYESVTLFENPSYDTACIGISEDERAVYDYDLMVKHLVDKDGMTEEEAEEFIEYNTIRAIPYFPNPPIVVRPFPKME
jgi:hypothetical protein